MFRPPRKSDKGAAAESGQKANPGLDRVNTFSSSLHALFHLYHFKAEYHSRQTLGHLGWEKLFQTVLGMLGESGIIGPDS